MLSTVCGPSHRDRPSCSETGTAHSCQEKKPTSWSVAAKALLASSPPCPMAPYASRCCPVAPNFPRCTLGIINKNRAHSLIHTYCLLQTMSTAVPSPEKVGLLMGWFRAPSGSGREGRNRRSWPLQPSRTPDQLSFCRVPLAKSWSVPRLKTRGHRPHSSMDRMSENVWPSLMHRRLRLPLKWDLMSQQLGPEYVCPGRQGGRVYGLGALRDMPLCWKVLQ